MNGEEIERINQCENTAELPQLPEDDDFFYEINEE